MANLFVQYKRGKTNTLTANFSTFGLGVNHEPHTALFFIAAQLGFRSVFIGPADGFLPSSIPFAEFASFSFNEPFSGSFRFRFQVQKGDISRIGSWHSGVGDGGIVRYMV
jgi:hypothetical protein